MEDVGLATCSLAVSMSVMSSLRNGVHFEGVWNRAQIMSDFGGVPRWKGRIFILHVHKW